MNHHLRQRSSPPPPSDVDGRHRRTPGAEDDRRTAVPSRCRRPRWQQIRSVRRRAVRRGRDRRRERAPSSTRTTASVGATSGAPTIAGNWTRERACGPWRSPRARPAHPTEVGGRRPTTADKHDLKIGDELRTMRRRPVTSRRRSSASPPSPSPTPVPQVVYFDTATAQRELLGERGPVQPASTVTRAPTASVRRPQLEAERLRRAGRHATRCRPARRRGRRTSEDVGELPGRHQVRHARLRRDRAVLVGIFLIINTFSMLVAQRTREIGLMRAIGSSRRQVNRLGAGRGAACSASSVRSSASRPVSASPSA